METLGKCKTNEYQCSQKGAQDFFAFPHPISQADTPVGETSVARAPSSTIEDSSNSKITNAKSQPIPPIKLASLSNSYTNELTPAIVKQGDERPGEQVSSTDSYSSRSIDLTNENRVRSNRKSDIMVSDKGKETPKGDVTQQCSPAMKRFDTLHRAPLRFSQSSLVNSPRQLASYNAHPYPDISAYSALAVSFANQPRPIMPLSHLNSKKGVSKSRYTAEENLFILTARRDPFKIPWRIMPEIAARWYSAGRGRNGRNMQVHYSQNVKPRLSSLDELNDDMQEYLTNSVNARLPVFYHGVLEELRKVEPSDIQLPTSLVAHSTRTWIDYSKQKLSCSLDEAVEMKALKMKRASCGGDKIDFTKKKNQ